MAVVEVQSDGSLVWVTINNPPVNATSTAVRAGLLDAVAEVQGHDLAILCAAGRTFVAGGDITEFDRPAEEPHLPHVVQAIEDSATPFLAVLHGTVLGGGLEIAMGCAYRIAHPDTRFGLPEIGVGVIPGAGGTQRAPRLFGWDAAADMACHGKLVSAERALELGAIDAIHADGRAAARAFEPHPVVPVSQRQAPPLPAEWRDAQAARLKKGGQAPAQALEALTWATEPFSDAQPRERARHLAMRTEPESKALRHMFLAERAVTKPARLRDQTAQEIGEVAVVGGGLMGASIAAAHLLAGIKVRVIERDADAADAAHDRIHAIIAGAQNRGKITPEQAAEHINRLSCQDSMDAAGTADLAIEAVFEDLATKQQVFAQLQSVVRPNALLATNTSYLDPRAIFHGIARPERCVGLHFFAPAHIMRLLEVVALPETSDTTLASAFALGKRLRKVPVLAGICDGFIGNRILAAYRRGAEYLLADGATPAQIDAAMRGFGLAMGPFEAQDMSGLQIAEANRRRQDGSRPKSERYVPLGDQLCAMGRLGQRAGAGWYDYAPGDKTPRPAQAVTDLIADYAAEQGLARQNYTDTDIQTRLLAIMANEGARIVDEGIAERDAAVDVVKVMGYGFPRWRGGPMHWAASQGADQIRRALDAMDADSPGSWTRAARYRDTTGGE